MANGKKIVQLTTAASIAAAADYMVLSQNNTVEATKATVADVVEAALKALSGYDASKTQVLKHVSGSLQWVDEQE